MDIGINLSGAEAQFNGTNAYTFPTHDELDYFASEGMSTVRLLLSWEGLQPQLNGQLSSTYLAQIQSTVNYANSLGLKVILDLHNFGKYNGNLIGSAQTPVSSFSDVWGKLAGQFATNSNVTFGLMNETQVQSPSAWLADENAAIAAIRGAGATSQEILVSGVDWDGGSSWVSSGNAAVFGVKGAIVDSSNNYAIEVHQYLDATCGGVSSTVVSADIGVQRLEGVTAWAQATGNKLYLGETGVASDTLSTTALNNELNYVEENQNVWQGASYWAAGSDWNNYMFSVEPELGILDMPQMSVLREYGNLHVVTIILANGDVQLNAYATNGTTLVRTDITSASGVLLSRTLFDADGSLDRNIVVNSNGNMTLTLYGSNSVVNTIEVFNSNLSLISKTTVNADGSETVLYYSVGTSTINRTQSYNAAGVLTSEWDLNSNGSYSISNYVNGYLNVVADYTSANVMTQKTTYDTKGNVISVETPIAGGDYEIKFYTPGQTTATSMSTYSSTWTLLSTTTYSSNGTAEVTTYYNSNGTPSEKINYLSNGAYSISTYSGGKLSMVEDYSAAKAMTQKTTYDTSGNIVSVETPMVGGDYEIASYTPGQTTPTAVTIYSSTWVKLSLTTYSSSGTVQDTINYNSNGSESAKLSASKLSMYFTNSNETVTSFGDETLSLAGSTFHDTILNFHGGAAAGHDTVELSKSLATSFGNLSIASSQTGTVVTIDGQHSIAFSGLTSSLTASDFKFV